MVELQNSCAILLDLSQTLGIAGHQLKANLGSSTSSQVPAGCIWVITHCICLDSNGAPK